MGRKGRREGDEQRLDEVARGKLGLADEVAEGAGPPQPAQAGLRERHAKSEDRASP